MCGGIQYQDQKIYFPQSDASLPVKLRHGGVTWIIWGRREEAIGKFPNGGWARLDSIKAGKWEPRHPRPVLIPAESFMKKDHDKQFIGSLWHLIWLSKCYGEKRVYVVTEETLPEYN